MPYRLSMQKNARNKARLMTWLTCTCRIFFMHLMEQVVFAQKLFSAQETAALYSIHLGSYFSVIADQMGCVASLIALFRLS